MHQRPCSSRRRPGHSTADSRVLLLALQLGRRLPQLRTRAVPKRDTLVPVSQRTPRARTSKARPACRRVGKRKRGSAVRKTARFRCKNKAWLQRSSNHTLHGARRSLQLRISGTSLSILRPPLKTHSQFSRIWSRVQNCTPEELAVIAHMPHTAETVPIFFYEDHVMLVSSPSELHRYVIPVPLNFVAHVQQTFCQEMFHPAMYPTTKQLTLSETSRPSFCIAITIKALILISCPIQ